MLNSPDLRTIWITVANRFRASDGIAPHRYDTVHNGRPAAQLNNRRKIVGQIVVMLTSACAEQAQKRIAQSIS